MKDLYEIQVVACTSAANAGNIVRFEHRFPAIPPIETIKLLQDEAARYYEALYGDDPDVRQVVAMRLTNAEVAAAPEDEL